MAIEYDKRPEGEKPRKQTAMFIAICNGKVLLEERIEEGKSFYGLVIVPAGKFDSNSDKTIADTAIREGDEEYGLDLFNSTYLGKFEDITPHQNHYLVSVFVKVFETQGINNLEPNKHIPHWVDIDEAEAGLVFAKDILAIKMAKEYLSRQD